MFSRLRNASQTKKTLVLSTVSAILCGSIQSEWIFWIPGAVFGILFAIANFYSKSRIGLYTALSSVIYICAVQIFFKTADSDLSNYLISGFLAGGFGAFALALLTTLISKTSFVFSRELLSTITGGITGIIFVQLFILGMGDPFISGDEWKWIFIPFAFIMWQVPVGWLLTTSIQPKPNLSDGLSTNTSG